MADLWVVRRRHHDSNGGLGLLGAECGQQTHPEHDVVQLIGTGSKASCAILQNQPCWFRVQIRLLADFFKMGHFLKAVNKQIKEVSLVTYRENNLIWMRLMKLQPIYLTTYRLEIIFKVNNE